MSAALFRRSIASGRRESRRAITIAVVLAVALGILTALQTGAAAAVAGGMAFAGAVYATLSSTAFRPRRADFAAMQFRWVAVGWAFLLIEPIGHFTPGRSRLAAVAGVPSVENVIQLFAYGCIAAVALFSLKRNALNPRPPFVLLAFPVLALLSAAWSLVPTVTLGFSFELLAAALLAILTAALVGADPRLGRDLVRRTLRLTVQGIALLCVLGLIVRSGWVPDPGNGRARFAWPGGYPLYTAAEIGLAMLILVFARRRDIGFSWRYRAVLLVLLGACLYLSNARTTFAGLAVAALFGYWYRSKGRGAMRRLAGAAAIAITVILLIGSFGGPITQYLYRGETQQQVSGLNGRIGLWTIGLNQLNSPQRWLAGYGLNGTRALFASSTTWAGDAHSAWLELLLSLGILGVVAAAGLVVVTANQLLRAPPDGLLSVPVLTILFVFVLAMSPIGGGFAAPGPEPGLGFAVLSFCFAVTSRPERAVARAPARPRIRVQGELRPAPL